MTKILENPIDALSEYVSFPSVSADSSFIEECTVPVNSQPQGSKTFSIESLILNSPSYFRHKKIPLGHDW